ncbi:MAG: DEAD/DEAH box helicase [Marinilabiliales bacterium]|nr:DEAD/DEAH box helicase [Marinilabiliales bacterium]
MAYPGEVMKAAIPISRRTFREDRVIEEKAQRWRGSTAGRYIPPVRLNETAGGSISTKSESCSMSMRLYLLHGVTSSGKTEIYIHLMQEQLARGRQVLYMLPEIALTSQIIERLRRHFGDSIGVFHSRLTHGGTARGMEKGQRRHACAPFWEYGPHSSFPSATSG